MTTLILVIGRGSAQHPLLAGAPTDADAETLARELGLQPFDWAVLVRGDACVREAIAADPAVVDTACPDDGPTGSEHA